MSRTTLFLAGLLVAAANVAPAQTPQEKILTYNPCQVLPVQAGLIARLQPLLTPDKLLSANDKPWSAEAVAYKRDGRLENTGTGDGPSTVPMPKGNPTGGIKP